MEAQVSNIFLSIWNL